MCVSGAHQGSSQGFGSSETGLTDGFEPPCGYQELN